MRFVGEEISLVTFAKTLLSALTGLVDYVYILVVVVHVIKFDMIHLMCVIRLLSHSVHTHYLCIVWTHSLLTFVDW